MRKISFAEGSGGKVIIRLRAEDGALLHREECKSDLKALRQVARRFEAFGITADNLVAWFDTFDSRKGDTFDAPEPAAPVQPSILLRGMNEPDENGRTVPTLAEALDITDYPASAPVMK